MKNYKRNSALAITALAAFLITTGCHHKKAIAPEAPAPPAETSAAPTANITVTPDTINPGQSAALNWTTTNATDVSIDGIGPVETNGTKNVSPTETTTFHLVARGDGGSTDASATLTIGQAQAPTGNGTLSEAEFEQNVKPVFYDYDSYTVRPDAQPVVTQDASFLQSHPGVKILIAGYCDERGSEEYNLALGQNRANAAKAALVQAGVDGNRLRTISYGKEKQFCTQNDESCWQQNRRAQFSLDQ